jgi:hypothetical protein
MADALKAVVLYAVLVLMGAPLAAASVCLFAYAILGPWVWLYLQVFGS